MTSLVLEDFNEIASIVAEELTAIPEVNYYTLKKLFILFNKVVQIPQNRMTVDNVVIVFLPTLEIPSNVLKTMIVHPEVFQA
jgi:hypothetical protein